VRRIQNGDDVREDRNEGGLWGKSSTGMPLGRDEKKDMLRKLLENGIKEV
jgi:hypothetical protein